MTGPRRHRRAAGFTLLETLVALAILGVVLTTVFGIIGGGLRAAHRDEDRLLLALVAQNLLARSRLDLAPTEGPLSGDIGGGLRWWIEAEPYEPPEGILPEAPSARERESGLSPSGDEEGEADEGLTSGLASEPRDPNLGGGATDAEEAGGGFGSAGQREREQQRERVRLRLVRVTVEKGGQRFDLTSLAAEPRRERPNFR
jgi:type II secretion system protein I